MNATVAASPKSAFPWPAATGRSQTNTASPAALVRDLGPHHPHHFITLGALTAPSAAAALVPLPDPPAIRLTLFDLGVAILTLTEQYKEHEEHTDAPNPQRRLLHNDIVLVLNTTRSWL